MSTPHTRADLLQLLTQLKLSKDEARMLLTLYEHPVAPAGRLAEYAGLKRGNTYNILSALCAAGLAQEVIERGVKRFTAIPPQQLARRVEEQRLTLLQLAEDLAAAVPHFEALCPFVKCVPRVQVFRGSAGVKELYQFTLSCKEKLIRACSDFSALFPRRRSPELNAWLWDYAARRAERGIRYRGIVARSAESDLAFKKRAAHKRELRLLEHARLSIEINIFDRYVAITSTAEEMMGVLIESTPIADSGKQLFDALWMASPPYAIARKGRGRNVRFRD